ncbi:uncharacterized protein N7482_003023 [Penicillium canariense]|uniref:protein-ribulosamine 3-kinase n=1 Tax=Penicillium canariense TaxID=189055 RepID=A0A9W9IMS7_9EURO|nr:uncharacterized protein N7482_003023 [Penicillium canariense]KAJ5177146.1 hypothetical protein N7482_003023 [Penicillium canariense]
MADTSGEWVSGVEGNFKLHTAVVQAMPSDTRAVSADSWGASAWTKTAKVSVTLSDGTPKNYFLKCATGREARPLTEGEYHSATAIHSVVPGFVPKPCGWGQYQDDKSQVYFFLGDYHNMDVRMAPEPEGFAAKVAELHTKGKSPTGMFGFFVPTVCGIFERTVKWETSWAKCFANQLQDVIKYDNETNGIWPEFDAACKRVINAVIPRLLGALQSDGRSIEPVLIHGDLWEQNVGLDMETIAFDPGCTYAHNEMEFGTWRCSWAHQFKAPIYMRFYHRHIQPSDPVTEWDDRNRLYSLHPYLNDSAGHPGSMSRSM